MCGVLGVLPGSVGAIQANETIKLILGDESGSSLLINRLLLFDAWRMRFRELKLRKDPNYPVCVESRLADGAPASQRPQCAGEKKLA